ncbi:MAG TPA: LppP/LprE family lipoprotein [Mycobacteriales bacterium]|nr:LppP/LprE family lipoprotein [Mycobacteriales bacterium]
MTSRGFDPAGNERTWYPDHTLNALVGVKHDSADGYFQYGFFFVNGRYIGRDTKEASATVKYVAGTDRMVTLQYAIYSGTDPNCCPSQGTRNVRYLWNGQQLVPLDAIPPTNGTGRR